MRKEQRVELEKKLNLQNLAWKSFVVKNLSIYFTRIYIIKAFVVALLLSAFIYLDYFELTFTPINSLCAVVGFYLLLGEHRVVWYWSGFFIGVLWFYWISFSFVYYDLAFLIPFIILGIACVYGLLFLVIGRFGKTIYLQVPLLLGVSFIDPFGFNWLKLEVILLDTYFSTRYEAFILFMIGVGCLKLFSNKYKVFGVLPLLASLTFLWSAPNSETVDTLNVAIPHMNTPQSQRWDAAYQKEAIALNFKLIEQAIAENKELIILPETAFPLYLNQASKITDTLRDYSHNIAIVTGSLTYDEEKGFFNSSYFFHEGKMQIAHKIILVPFGEEIPFPEFFVDIINRLFFDGAKDYQKAKEPQNFIINGKAFRSAICYEATTNKLFQNTPKQMIAISNNAWFSPSTEQTLQHLLLRYYAKKYQTTIYHSANSGKSGIIKP